MTKREVFFPDALCFSQVIAIAAKDPRRTLVWLSTGSGVLLIVGGISGVFTLNPLSMIISIYNVLLGVLIVLTELKTFPIIRTFQKRVDVYFHLLSVPRGKGAFYCFIGLLAFCATSWSKEPLARACVLVVFIVGLLHLLMCKRCGAPGPEEQEAGGVQPMQAPAEGGGGFTDVSAQPTSWGQMMKQVVSDSPEVLTAGLSAVTATASAVAASGVLSDNTTSNGNNGGSGAAGDVPLAPPKPPAVD